MESAYAEKEEDCRVVSVVVGMDVSKLVKGQAFLKVDNISVVIIGCIRLALYYYRFRPDNIDRSYSVTITTSGMEVNIALIACCGPALKALSHRYFPGLFGSQSGGTHRNTVYYDPEGYNRSGGKGNTSYRHREHLSSKGDRPQDAQYGLRDLGPVGRETDGDSQEAIVHAESVSTKRDDELDFGFDAVPVEPRKTYWRSSS